MFKDLTLGFSHELQKVMQAEMTRLLSIVFSFLNQHQFALLVYFDLNVGITDYLLHFFGDNFKPNKIIFHFSTVQDLCSH